MQVEATMVLMDNSDYSRNGDLYPSRWEAQMEAIQLIANQKLGNMESGVGLILSGGKQVQLLMTPTNDQNQLISTCENQRLRGQIKFSVALYIAQLTLKHRVNKKQSQRIMAFVASPVEEDEASLISLAKKLKKNNIAVDIVNFGEQKEEHLAKLQKFVEAVRKGTNSTFINIESGPQSALDQLFTALSNNAQVFESAPGDQQQPNQQQQNPQVIPNVNQFAEYGGVDPNIDPELAMAIKLSLEEEKSRVPQQPQNQQQPSSTSQGAMLEEPLLHANKPKLIDSDNDNIEEEELLRKAKELSLDEESKDQKDQKQKKANDINEELFQDPEFMEELLKSADVDLESEEIQKLLKKGDDKSDKKK